MSKEKQNIFDGLFDDLQWEDFKEIFPQFFGVLGKIINKEEGSNVK